MPDQVVSSSPCVHRKLLKARAPVLRVLDGCRTVPVATESMSVA